MYSSVSELSGAPAGPVPGIDERAHVFDECLGQPVSMQALLVFELRCVEMDTVIRVHASRVARLLQLPLSSHLHHGSRVRTSLPVAAHEKSRAVFLVIGTQR